jgi:hypothetical protein
MMVFACGMRKVQRSSGKGTGESAICTVFASAATAAIGAATGVLTEPMIRSTLSSLVKRLALRAPLVGSVASSRTMTLIFWPATVCGQRST